MTNSVFGVDSSINPSAYTNSSAATNSELFSAMLRTQMNTSTKSIASFKEDDDDNDFSLSGGTGSSVYGSDSLSALTGNSSSALLGGLLGSVNGNSDSSTGINSETMLAMLILALAMGNSNGGGSELMLSSFSNALTNRYSYVSSGYQANQSRAAKGLALTNSAYKSTYVTPGSGKYPSSMGYECSPSIVNNMGNRSAAAYNRVVQQFNVETSGRYTPYKNGSTYCNIYVWDVTTAMGAEIPHRTDKNGDIADSGDKNITYMTANRMYDWLGGKGKEYGWKEVSAQEAQRYANMGCPAVTAWKNPKGHGHIQMVVPSKDGSYNEKKGVAISQAGSKVIDYGYITDVYSSKRLKDIKYFVHA